VLAGIARLRLADEAYAAGKGAEAVTAYEAAVPAPQDSALAARARLGVAMARIQAGRTADGETALRELVGQADLAKATRAEAGYHLATLAYAGGRTDEVLKYCDQIMEIDAGSAWAQRAQMLRLQATVASTQGRPLPAPSPVPAAPADAGPEIKLNLPTGKWLAVSRGDFAAAQSPPPAPASRRLPRMWPARARRSPCPRSRRRSPTVSETGTSMCQRCRASRRA